MTIVRGRILEGISGRFMAAIVLALVFALFVTLDQTHWWQIRSDYAFGWLVPILVGYVVHERWGRIRAIFANPGARPMAPGMSCVVDAAAAAVFAAGLGVFLLGALYRAGAGSTQPGSLALAAGFAGVTIGLVYFNAPDGRVGTCCPSVWGTLRCDARLRAAALFLFPALVWMLSAPLVTAVENAVSLFLLRKVVTVVFTLFSFLGYPLVQEGNVLVLPHGRVGVADACSGIRSLTACLFAGSFLAAVYLDRLWAKMLLIASAMALAFATNLLRSLFLTGWAYAFGSDAIEGTLHDATGFAVLGLTTLALFCILPLFKRSNWERWLGLYEPPGEGPT
jgi:exosortase